jgi:methylmalonyl-CoA mutase cobalamin-binding domain/chain
MRVLLAKVGLDGHDRGIKIVAHYLMQAGMEVIYLGLRSTPEQVAAAALDEDVDVVGLSFLAGDHMILAPRIVEALKRKGRGDVLVLVGGIVLARDIPRLEAMGVRKVFLPGTPPGEIVNFIRSNAKAPEGAVT